MKRFDRTALLILSALTLPLGACGKGGGGSPLSISVSKVENGRVTLKYVNDSAKEVTGGYIRFYCYGADGNQSGVESVTLNFSIKPGATRDDNLPIRCASSAASVETEWYSVNFGDQSKWENPTQPPEQRPKGGKK